MIQFRDSTACCWAINETMPIARTSATAMTRTETCDTLGFWGTASGPLAPSTLELSLSLRLSLAVNVLPFDQINTSTSGCEIQGSRNQTPVPNRAIAKQSGRRRVPQLADQIL